MGESWRSRGSKSSFVSVGVGSWQFLRVRNRRELLHGGARPPSPSGSPARPPRPSTARPAQRASQPLPPLGLPRPGPAAARGRRPVPRALRPGATAPPRFPPSTRSPVFLGNSTHNLDSKGRVFIPKRVTGKLPADSEGVRRVLVCPGLGDCVALYTEPAYERMRERLATGTFEDPEVLRLQRFLFPMTFEVELDSASRLLVPEPLRDMAGLHDEVLLAGLVDRVELWDSARFAAQAAGARDEFLRLGSRWAKGQLGAAAPVAAPSAGAAPGKEGAP